jgi:hypothetical protein
MAERFGVHAYVECSAKDLSSVQEVFSEALEVGSKPTPLKLVICGDSGCKFNLQITFLLLLYESLAVFEPTWSMGQVLGVVTNHIFFLPLYIFTSSLCICIINSRQNRTRQSVRGQELRRQTQEHHSDRCCNYATRRYIAFHLGYE